jgi:pimeloyl-ACP methyl ester carboxylesterase
MITQPTLITLGTKDPVISYRQDGKIMAQAISHGQLALLKTGHASFAEAPEAFLEVLYPFLKSL